MKEIKLYAGCDLENAFVELHVTGEECFTKFNGHILTSDDTIDIIYLKVTGKTKEEFYKNQKNVLKLYVNQQKDFESKIPELTEQYIKEAEGVIIPDKLDYWKEIVPVRLSDIYRGMELDQVLTISKIMNDEKINFEERLKKSYKIFNDCGHSGCSAKLTMAMLREFCPYGNEIADAINEFKYEEK